MLYGVRVVLPCFLLMFAFAVPLSPTEIGVWGSWLVMPLTLGVAINEFLRMIYISWR